MQSFRIATLPLVFLLSASPSYSAVVINEILYHAPNDLDRLQFIELHNTGDQTVDLSKWTLRRDADYEFAAGTRIAAGGYIVICRDRTLFRKTYGFDASGEFERPLSPNSGRIVLVNAKGEKIDTVRYESRAPWPLAADGHSSSLERICSNASGEDAENWAPSPLPSGAPSPGGTPGKKNTVIAPHLPPVIATTTVTPTHAAPGQEVQVSAHVRSSQALSVVELRYRVAQSGSESKEQSIVMSHSSNGRYSAAIPGQKAGQIIRCRIRAVDTQGVERVFPNANELRPAMSIYVHEPFKCGNFPFGLIINVGEGEYKIGKASTSSVRFLANIMQPNAPPARGRSAFVYVDPKTNVPQLFDFVTISPRSAGCKVRFHKDRPLNGMTVINLIYEYMDRFVLAEPLAYEVYRKAGNAACSTDFVRTWIDGRPIGYQLLIEQPNKAFLRHNRLRTDGNMYKIIWWTNDIVAMHEKKTHPNDGHDDIVQLVKQLHGARGDAQWEVIKRNFDVEQFINYFAVNTVLSHWDGFFNNYFTYHDVRGTKKWTIYPWDQDKTWGFHDGITGYGVFYDMPITFGMTGDQPPGGGTIWWRPGGVFSRPMLAHPRFRKLFLARTKELLETVYTEEVFFPIIKDMGQRLEDEVRFRAEIRREDSQRALAHHEKNLEALREHLVKRRKFLLDQDEIKQAGKFDRAELK